MKDICERCQLYSHMAGCTRLEGEDCIKESLQLVCRTTTNGELFMMMNLGSEVLMDSDSIVCVNLGSGLIINFPRVWWFSRWKGVGNETID